MAATWSVECANCIRLGQDKIPRHTLEYAVGVLEDIVRPESILDSAF
jgi:hypothetical protein